MAANGRYEKSSPRPVDFSAGLLFVPSLALAIVVGIAIDVLFGALTVALEQPVWLLENVRAAIATLLAGSLLPLAFYPWGLRGSTPSKGPISSRGMEKKRKWSAQRPDISAA